MRKLSAAVVVAVLSSLTFAAVATPAEAVSRVERKCKVAGTDWYFGRC